MCGISGILSLSPGAPVIEAELRTMAAQIVHRGPDDEGIAVFAGGQCGLAFRRLAIIDVVHARQPMSNENGKVWTVFNGEIYNFRELRAELAALGHVFVTDSDTEVIVHAYEQWGGEFLTRLAGMFALAVWDERAGKLLLARDRFGKKPLVMAVHANRLYFASEAKAILALPGFPRRIDPRSLHDYLVLQYVPAPASIYDGFEKMLPGHFRVVRAEHPDDFRPHVEIDSAIGEHSVAEQQAYWRLPQPPTYSGTYDEAKVHLGTLLTKAVQKRLVSDVPLGAFLSGGIDSSIVVGLMRRLGVSPLRTFSIGFSDRRYDETSAARQVARLFETEHHEEIVTPSAAEILDTLAYHYDEPFADSSAIPTYYVSSYTRQSVTVALTGDGGDEAFLGYDRYRAAQLAARLDRYLPGAVRVALAGISALLPHGRAKSRGNRAYRFFSTLAQNPDARYASWVTVFGDAELRAAYRAETLAAVNARTSAEEWLKKCTVHFDRTDVVARANRTDFLSYLPYDLLTKVDIASMACSLECRAPFLDHDLVEFALSLPTEWKLGSNGGKRILRDWAASLLPPQILNRPKMGFGVPIGEWFRGELRGLIEETLFASTALSATLFKPNWLRRLVDDHIAGRANHAHRLWSLLMLELWQKRWNTTL